MKRLIASLTVLALLCSSVFALDPSVDIPLCLDRIRHKAKYSSAKTIADMQAHWQDQVQTLPTEAEIQAAWTAILAERAATESDATSRTAKGQNLKGNTVNTLRAWSADTDADVAAWDNANQTARNAAVKKALNRISIMFSRFADMIESQRLDK